MKRIFLATLLALIAAMVAAPVSAAAPASWNLISGQRITNNTSARCTLGFNAFRGTTRYVLASGRCTSAGGTWSGVGGVIGPAVASSFPGNDFGLIQVTSGAALSTPLVDRYTSGADVTITGATTPPVGTTLCYSSPATGWQCGGTVTALNATVCYAEGCVTGLIRTTLCPDPGASGAPVVTNPGTGTTVRAVGLMTGGSGNCTSGGVSYVQPILEPLQAYGLTLVTG